MNKDEVYKNIVNRVRDRARNESNKVVEDELRSKKVTSDHIMTLIDVSIFKPMKQWFANEDTIVFPYIGRFTIKEGRKEKVNNNAKQNDNGTEE